MTVLSLKHATVIFLLGKKLIINDINLMGV